MNKIFILFFLFIFTIAQQGHAVSIEEFVSEVTSKAERGDTAAQTMLGAMYENGIMVSQNPKKAFEWYLSAANHDDPQGQTLVGRAYADGRGVQKDEDEALSWFRKSVQTGLKGFSTQPIFFNGGSKGAIEAAKIGNVIAQGIVGSMYLTGHGVVQSDTEAVRWLTKAAESGHSAGSEYTLALLYQEGRGGLPRDIRKAMNLYRRGAEQSAKNIVDALQYTCSYITGRPDGCEMRR